MLAFLLLTAALPLLAETGRVVEGIDRSRILPPPGAKVSDYTANGYRLVYHGDEVVVEIDTAPLASTARYTPPRRWQGDEISRLARGLVTGASIQYEAVSRILGWVARHLDYNLDRSESQDAQDVLKRRSGYCTGVARLTVALFTAAGIEAREVAGYVVGEGYHRWVEVRFSDRGWVMSDPLRSHHYVSSIYLRLASQELATGAGIDGLLIARDDRIATTDQYSAGVAGVTARRNDDRRLAGAVRVEIRGHAVGLAILENPAVRYSHALLDGATTFVGLTPGSYQLRVQLPGIFIERRVELPDRILVRLVIDESPHLAAMPTSPRD
jgi:hypothetical protein